MIGLHHKERIARAAWALSNTEWFLPLMAVIAVTCGIIAALNQ